MAISLLIGGAIAAGGAFVAHQKGKEKAEEKGYNRGKEEAEEQINMLTLKLHKFQEKKEKTKKKFESVVSGISNIDTKDDNFFSKIASFIRGYKNFHVFTMAIISFTKYRCLEHNLNETDSNDLKTITLGLIEAGFPKKLKYNISEVWNSKEKTFVGSQYERYKNKLKESLISDFNNVCNEINELIQDFKELNKREREVNKELKKLNKAS